jgi:hypothetical protein
VREEGVGGWLEILERIHCRAWLACWRRKECRTLNFTPSHLSWQLKYPASSFLGRLSWLQDA